MRICINSNSPNRIRNFVSEPRCSSVFWEMLQLLTHTRCLINFITGNLHDKYFIIILKKNTVIGKWKKNCVLYKQIDASVYFNDKTQQLKTDICGEIETDVQFFSFISSNYINSIVMQSMRIRIVIFPSRSYTYIAKMFNWTWHRLGRSEEKLFHQILSTRIAVATASTWNWLNFVIAIAILIQIIYLFIMVCFCCCVTKPAAVGDNFNIENDATLI